MPNFKFTIDRESIQRLRERLEKLTPEDFERMGSESHARLEAMVGDGTMSLAFRRPKLRYVDWKRRQGKLPHLVMRMGESGIRESVDLAADTVLESEHAALDDTQLE